MNLEAYLKEQLAERQTAGLMRTRDTFHSPQKASRLIHNQPCINFSSNDYLGLANDSRVAKEMMQAIKSHGVGSGASHLTSGHHVSHQALEEALAEFTGRESALLFSSGYMANMGVICALMKKGDAIFHDRLNHVSLLEAGLLSGAQSRRFPHLDYETLARRLSQCEVEKRLVVTDGVFSMDGDQADLSRLSSLCQTHQAWLMVDDAHGLGVLGQQGAGSAESFHLSQDELPILMGTLGKAFGTAGAFVAGSKQLIETLIQLSKTYTYTTAMPPSIAQATLVSLGIIQSEPWRRDHLASLMERFRTGCQSRGITVMPSVTPIQPLIVGNLEQTVNICETLRRSGCWVSAIRPPTVPKGTSRIRVTLTAEHQCADVDTLLVELEKAMELYHVAAG